MVAPQRINNFGGDLYFWRLPITVAAFVLFDAKSSIRAFHFSSFLRIENTRFHRIVFISHLNRLENCYKNEPFQSSQKTAHKHEYIIVTEIFYDSISRINTFNWDIGWQMFETLSMHFERSSLWCVIALMRKCHIYWLYQHHILT